MSSNEDNTPSQSDDPVNQHATADQQAPVKRQTALTQKRNARRAIFEQIKEGEEKARTEIKQAIERSQAQILAQLQRTPSKNDQNVALLEAETLYYSTHPEHVPEGYQRYNAAQTEFLPGDSPIVKWGEGKSKIAAKRRAARLEANQQATMAIFDEPAPWKQATEVSSSTMPLAKTGDDDALDTLHETPATSTAVVLYTPPTPEIADQRRHKRKRASHEGTQEASEEFQNLSKEAIAALLKGFETDDDEPTPRKRSSNQDPTGLPKLLEIADPAKTPIVRAEDGQGESDPEHAPNPVLQRLETVLRDFENGLS